MNIRIDYLGGNCPVQAWGMIDGREFYFRARGQSWSMQIGDWYRINPWGDGPYAAGWMPEETARQIIENCAAECRSESEAPHWQPLLAPPADGDVRPDCDASNYSEIPPTCPRCGNNRQVWRNQLTGKPTCRRWGCDNLELPGQDESEAR